MQSAVIIIACMLCRADRSFRMRTCHFAALLIFLTKVSFEASKFASYYPSCFVVRVVAALFDFLLLKFVVPNMKRKSIFVGLFDAGLSWQFHSPMSNRLFRMYHLLTCTVIKGRSGCSKDFSSRSFLRRSYEPTFVRIDGIGFQSAPVKAISILRPGGFSV